MTGDPFHQKETASSIGGPGLVNPEIVMFMVGIAQVIVGCIGKKRDDAMDFGVATAGILAIIAGAATSIIRAFL